VKNALRSKQTSRQKSNNFKREIYHENGFAWTCPVSWKQMEVLFMQAFTWQKNFGMKVMQKNAQKEIPVAKAKFKVLKFCVWENFILAKLCTLCCIWFNDNKAKFNDFFEMLDEEDKTLCDRCKLLNNMSNEGNCIHHLFGAKVNDWSWLEKKD